MTVVESSTLGRSVVVGSPALGLALRLSTLGIEAALDRTATGSGRPPALLHHERIGQTQAQSVEGEAAVAQLGAFVVGRHDDHPGAELGEDPVALPLGESGRFLDVEAHLGPGVGAIGVLAAGAAAGTETPVELGRGDDDARGDPQCIVGRVHPPSLRAATPYAAAMNGHEWITAFAAELGLEPLTEAEVESLLDLASVAAHSSERLAAPLTCYLAAKARIAPADALDRARALADAQP